MPRSGEQFLTGVDTKNSSRLTSHSPLGRMLTDCLKKTAFSSQIPDTTSSRRSAGNPQVTSVGTSRLFLWTQRLPPAERRPWTGSCSGFPTRFSHRASLHGNQPVSLARLPSGSISGDYCTCFFRTRLTGASSPFTGSTLNRKISRAVAPRRVCVSSGPKATGTGQVDSPRVT